MFAMLNYLRVKYFGEKGQGIVEYALILAAIVVLAAALSTGSLGTAVTNTFKSVADKLTGTGTGN
ncbi:pilin protein [Pectinatus sottacetonis]|uniref:pilin protein n=1 Tax=Pectinatus sottacetonis TaxID=1002795 RepID=UPI0018C6ED0E|nr:pilin protein [Pectinatus sottacetonis]